MYVYQELHKQDHPLVRVINTSRKNQTSFKQLKEIRLKYLFPLLHMVQSSASICVVSIHAFDVSVICIMYPLIILDTRHILQFIAQRVQRSTWLLLCFFHEQPIIQPFNTCSFLQFALWSYVALTMWIVETSIWQFVQWQPPHITERMQDLDQDRIERKKIELI